MTERGARDFRLRVAYKKDDRLAFLEHLELIGTDWSAVRKSAAYKVGNGYQAHGRTILSGASRWRSSEAEY